MMNRILPLACLLMAISAQAATVRGSRTYGTTGDYAANSARLAASMACWVKPAAVTADMTVVYSGVGATLKNFFDLKVAGAVGGDPVRMQITDSGTTQTLDTSGSVSAGVWSVASGFAPGGPGAGLFVRLDDGTPATGSQTGSPSSSDTTSIGLRKYGTPDQAFDGQIGACLVINTTATGMTTDAGRQYMAKVMSVGFPHYWVAPRRSIASADRAAGTPFLTGNAGAESWALDGASATEAPANESGAIGSFSVTGTAVAGFGPPIWSFGGGQ